MIENAPRTVAPRLRVPPYYVNHYARPTARITYLVDPANRISRLSEIRVVAAARSRAA